MSDISDVPVVLLAGGFGTRISEESHLRPKPMIEVGGQPIIWHIMKIFSHYGCRRFIICLGYKGYLIKEYFANYFLHNSDLTINTATNETTFHNTTVEQWQITLVDTGLNTMTGGRLKRVQKYLDNRQAFFMTYGDGLADIDVGKLFEFHTAHGCQATLTAVSPPARFGALSMNEDYIESFKEKPEGDEGLVNGGFFVLNQSVLHYIDDDSTIWERKPLEELARSRQLVAYHHDGFWKPMDTLRDKIQLEDMWSSQNPPWKVWK